MDLNTLARIFLALILLNFFNNVAPTEDPSLCDHVTADKVDPALLKNYPDSVIRAAKGCFQSVYNLTNVLENTKTADNITIKLMHLVDSEASDPLTGTREPILFMHGLFGSPYVWLLNDKPTDLVFRLYQSNFDIWLGSERSSYYSVNKHQVSIDEPDSYWNYSWHEVGALDLPAMIDNILEKSHKTSLRLVCHSQGCTAFLVMASLMPEYAAKVSIVHALAPAVYLQYSKSPIFSMAAGFFKHYKYPYQNAIAMNFHQFCLKSTPLLNKCIDLCFKIFGHNPDQLNKTMLPVYLYHYPTISSLREHMHFYQMHKTGRFAPFDEGFLDGNPTNTPEYLLENIKLPIALYYCENDMLVSVQDIERLALQLPNVVDKYMLPLKNCNHMDPVIGIDSGEILFDRIMQVEKKLNLREV